MESVSFSYFLPWLMGLPILGALLAIPLVKRGWVKPLTLLSTFTLAQLLFAGLFLLLEFPKDNTPLLHHHWTWSENLGLRFDLALDRLNFPFVLLTTAMFFLCSIYSQAHQPKRPLLFTVAFLTLETTLLGAFLAYDLLLFYIFWEALLLPMAIIVGVFGALRRIQAAMKFLLFTVFGSLPMLLAVIQIYLQQQAQGLDMSIPALYQMQLPIDSQIWLYLALFLAFAVKFPLVPVHTWLPEAHVEAPTEGSVILAAILLKLGSYGLLRFAMPIFPEASVGLLGLLAPLALIGVIYASLICLVQQQAKKLVAYSSVAHMGFVALGLFSITHAGIQGSIYQMLNHGITTGALFFLIGMIYHRSERRNLDEFGGLAKQMPILAALFLISVFSSIGVPGLNNFIGEFLILLGLSKSGYLPYPWIYTAIAVTAVILGAAYLLLLYRKIFFGPLRTGLAQFKDLHRTEVAILLPLVIMMLWMGLYPKPFLRFTEPATDHIVKTIEAKAVVARVK